MSASYLRGCVQKRRYEHRDEALAHRNALIAKQPGAARRLSVYRCVQCGGYHVGHSKAGAR